MALGSKIKELRFRNGKSLQQVADSVGASKAHIWELETGKSRNPSLALIRRLAEHFEVTVASLIGELPGDAEDLDAEDLLVMYRDLKGLSEEDRETIKLLIKGLKQRQKERTSGEN